MTFFVSSNAASLIPLGPTRCHFTNESKSKMSFTPLIQTSRCHCYRWVRLSDVLVTAESDSAMSLLPLSQTPRCHCYRWVWLHSVMDTADYRVVYDNGRLESFAVTFDCFSRDVLIVEIMTHYNSSIVDTWDLDPAKKKGSNSKSYSATTCFSFAFFHCSSCYF